MPIPPHRSVRLEPRPSADARDAIRGRVHDPLWFVARQWQMGEFQGENATTPVQVHLDVTSVPMWHVATGTDPGGHPAEALLEAEPDDWWTVGRRVRLGAVAAAAATSVGTVLPEDDGLRLNNLPAAYESLAGAWDGLALWRRRAALGIPDETFGEVPTPAEQSWDESELVYERPDAFRAGASSFDVRRHRGGELDWYSVDAHPVPEEAPVSAVPEPWLRLPTRLEFPGMPRWGLWEIEDARADIGAVPPDAAHTATSLMTALFFSRRDEWFDVPVPGRAGGVLRITRVRVTDCFGVTYDSDEVLDEHPPQDAHAPRWPGLHPPSQPEWTLFRVAGLDPADLLLWQVAVRPLASEVMELVQFGIDDASNVVWAVERRLRDRDATSEQVEPGGESLVPAPPGDLTVAKAYAYIPGQGAAPHWIPYTIEDSGHGVAFVQRRLADYSTAPPTLLPLASARVLTTASGDVHRLVPAAVPATGMQLERRWQLARTIEGSPVLWVERRRRPLLGPPARRLRFDVAAPTSSPLPGGSSPPSG